MDYEDTFTDAPNGDLTMPKYIVCPECEGEGYVGTLGSYTADEFRETFEDVCEYRALHEASKEWCPCCRSQRVVTAERLAEWDEEAEIAAEQRYGY